MAIHINHTCGSFVGVGPVQGKPWSATGARPYADEFQRSACNNVPASGRALACVRVATRARSGPMRMSVINLVIVAARGPVRAFWSPVASPTRQRACSLCARRVWQRSLQRCPLRLGRLGIILPDVAIGGWARLAWMLPRRRRWGICLVLMFATTCVWPARLQRRQYDFCRLRALLLQGRQRN